MKNIDKNKKIASEWFKHLQNHICEELELIENKNKKSKNLFSKKKWTRDKKGSNKLGGGEMRLLRGDVFEKAGVNVSTVFGQLSKNLKEKFLEQKIIQILGIGYFFSYSSIFTKNSSYTHEYKIYCNPKIMVWRGN